MAMLRRLWSVSALATEMGIDRRTMAKRLENIPAAGEAQKGRPGWRLTDVIVALYGSAEGGERINAEVEKGRLLKAQADLAQLEVRKREGDLLPADEVARVDEAVMTAIRDAFLALPDGVAEVVCEVAASEGPTGVAALLRERVETILEDASNAEFDLEGQGDDLAEDGRRQAA